MKFSGLFLLSLAALIFGLLPAFAPAQYAHADSNSDIQAQIDQHNQQISQIEQQIAAYQGQLNVLGTQKQTLQTAINSIDVTKSKTTAQISLTNNQITSSNLTINKLGTQILTKQQAIDLDKQTLASSLRIIQDSDNTSPLLTFLSADSLADAWQNIDAQTQLNEALQQHAIALSGDTLDLKNQQDQVAATKQELTQLNKQLTDQKNQLVAAESAKQQLLTQTKSKESTYQSLIAQKKAQEKSFESELSDLQSQLKNVSSSEIPKSGDGILAWPFSDAVMKTCVGKTKALGNQYCITQYFGNTDFATQNPSIYNGMGHDGLDIGVPIGTAVHAALTGTILGTGNTDLVHNKAGQQCYSFGKWVMIQHANGLNTMYAHLSSINVTKGQSVSTGDVIGYSGETGYATGPHLHFGVYASAGVQIQTLSEFRGATTPCANATMPVAPVNAYLNPLSYLPH